jgi:hypothetical protein
VCGRLIRSPGISTVPDCGLDEIEILKLKHYTSLDGTLSLFLVINLMVERPLVSRRHKEGNGIET